jgi:hypothetical protein
MPVLPQLRPKRIMRERVALLDDVVLPTFGLWRSVLAYTLLWWALLLWAGWTTRSAWFAGVAAAPAAAQVMCASAILTPLFIPFVVCFPLIQTRRHPFSSVRLTFSKTTHEYIRKVVSCSLLTLVPLSSVYVLFALMNWLGLVTDGPVTHILLGRSFLIFDVSLVLLTSTTAIGLALSRSRVLHLLATAVAVSTVTSPFILSELVTGTGFLSHLVTLVQAVGNSTAPSGVLLLVSLLTGSSFSLLHRRKPS